MHKQDGFVSIIITSIVMIILTLIVIGFSQIMQREQRQALDRQLSSQAFYAAETAVNDVYARLQDNTLTLQEKVDCSVADWPTVGANGVIDPNEPDVAYTCLLFDRTPASLEFNNGAITTQQSKIFPIQPVSNGNLRSMTFNWSGAQGVTDIEWNDCSSDQALPETLNNRVPILRVDLMRLRTGTPIDRAVATDETTHFFLYPQQNCGGVPASTYTNHTAIEQKGQVINVNCGSSDNTSGYACSFTMTGMDDPSTASNRFIARVKSIYNDADLQITATTADDAVVEFLGAQIAIDATGKANDVLRRISVQVGNPDYPIPEFVAQSMEGLCKGIEIAPPTIANYSCN